MKGECPVRDQARIPGLRKLDEPVLPGLVNVDDELGSPTPLRVSKPLE
jgi:hypothetical protein